MIATDIDSPERFSDIRQIILSKPGLKKWYEEIYQTYKDCLNNCPSEGLAIELGSGAGFAKDFIPELTTTDIIPYPGIDKVVDATKMDFADVSLRAIFLMNVLHHIPNAMAFFKEAERCLKKNGKILIIDQYPGLLAKPILKYAHHEPFDENTESWQFPSSGPLSGANGALAWIIFFRDQAVFEEKFPTLKIEKISRHTPLRYWLTGGLKKWSLLPGILFPLFTFLDHLLAKLFPNLASFMTIEITKS